MEKWLAEASFLLRLLMAPSSRPKGSGKDLSRAQDHLCLWALSTCTCHNLGLAPAPGASAPWPGSKSTPEELVSRLQAVGTTHGSEPAEREALGRACWWRLAGEGTQETCLRC